jgi:hypothetical protein
VKQHAQALAVAKALAFARQSPVAPALRFPTRLVLFLFAASAFSGA